MFSFTVERSFNLDSALVVPLTITGTATLGVDYQLTGVDTVGLNEGSVTILANSSTKQIAVIPIPSNRTTTLTVILSLQTVPDVFLLDQNRKQVTTFIEVDLANLPLVGVVLDPTFPEISATIQQVELDEGTGAALSPLYFELARTGDTLDSLVVNVSITGSALYQEDWFFASDNPPTFYGGLPTTVTFGVGVNIVSIPFYVVPDSIEELNEQIILTVLPGSDYTISANANTVITIVDDDATVSEDYLVKQVQLEYTNLSSIFPAWYVTNVSRSVVDIEATVQDGSQNLISLNLATQTFNSDLVYLDQEALGYSATGTGVIYYCRFNKQSLLAAAAANNCRYLVLSGFVLVNSAGSNIDDVHGTVSLQKGDYTTFNLNPVSTTSDLTDPYVFNDPNLSPIRYPRIDNKWYTRIVCQYVPATGFTFGGTRTVYVFGFYLQIDTQDIENVQYIPFNIIDPVATPPPIGYSYTTTYTKTTRPYSTYSL